MQKFNLNKNYLFIAACLMLLFISYQLALKKTVEAFHLHQKLEAQISSATLSEQPAYLARQDKALAAVIKAYKSDTVNYRNALVTQVSESGEKEQVRIIEVPVQNSLSTPQYQVQKVSLKGDFFALLKTLHNLGELASVGYIRSAVFKKGKEPNQAKEDKEITLDIYTEIVK